MSFRLVDSGNPNRTYTFPMSPTAYSPPTTKSLNIGYSINGDIQVAMPLYAQDEFILTWENVINDFNGIVIYLKNFIHKEIINNQKNPDPLFFSDGLGLWSGNVFFAGASISTKKIGGSIAYTFNITLKAN